MRRFALKIYFSVLIIAFNNIAYAQTDNIGHCYNSCPEGADDSNHLIVRPIYALSYNTITKSADWVAYKVSGAAIGIASSLSRDAVKDNYVEDTLAVEDFIDSESSNLVRSQYISLIDFAGTPFWRDVNYLTNSVARTLTLNQGAWYGLDWSIRNFVNRHGEVYVITGPIFDVEDNSLVLLTDTSHRVPNRFFKVIVNKSGHSAAFILAQSAAVLVHHCQMIATIDEI